MHTYRERVRERQRERASEAQAERERERAVGRETTSTQQIESHSDTKSLRDAVGERHAREVRL